VWQKETALGGGGSGGMNHLYISDEDCFALQSANANNGFVWERNVLRFAKEEFAVTKPHILMIGPEDGWMEIKNARKGKLPWKHVRHYVKRRLVELRQIGRLCY
jgi:hypothetical protein